MGTVPPQRVSNSDIHGQIQLLQEQLRSALEQVEGRFDSELRIIKTTVQNSEQNLKTRIDTAESGLKGKIDDHLSYHQQLLQTAKEISDRRFRVYGLIISIAAICTTIVIAVLKS